MSRLATSSLSHCYLFAINSLNSFSYICNDIFIYSLKNNYNYGKR